MMTLRRFLGGVESIPTPAAWYLEEIAESRGKQELFTRQSPQALKALREHALIESAVSSNRIEGVEVDQSRVSTLVFGRAALRDRNEEEVRGYRDALSLIHSRSRELALTEKTARELHRLSRGDDRDAGRYKGRDIDIIQTYPDGSSRVRFTPVSAVDTPRAMKELFTLWDQCIEQRGVSSLILWAALNLDFLCIHPFRDGNGRVSRLLLLLGCYHAGIEAGRYVSLERIIEEEKEQYYDVLEKSSLGWHEARHDPWPYIRFILYVTRNLCRQFEQRVGEVSAPRGAKTQMVEKAMETLQSPFTLRDIERVCPGVSRDMIRKVLKDSSHQGRLFSTGRGPGARWQRKGNAP